MRTLAIILVITIQAGFLAAQVSIDSIMREKSKFDADFIYEKELLVEVPGTSIKLMPPEHFVLSKQVPGFIHVGTSSTIQVTKIPSLPYVMIEKKLNEKTLSEQDVKFISKEDVELHNGNKGVLYLVEFISNNIRYERYILLTGNYHNTIWINASYPIRAKDIVQDILLNTILTAEFTDNII